MDNYKIKISCTSKEELSNNNRKISITNYNKNKLQQLTNNYDYIIKTIILHKSLQNFTTKTLEFLCNKLITDNDFKIFIQNMKDLGFYSNSKNSISFIKNDDPHELIHSYYYESLKIYKQKDQLTKIKTTNKSKYFTQML